MMTKTRTRLSTMLALAAMLLLLMVLIAEHASVHAVKMRVRGAKRQPRQRQRRHLQFDNRPSLSGGYGGTGAQIKGVEEPPRRTIAPAVSGGGQQQSAPTPAPVPILDYSNVTYTPGKLTVMENDLILSEGLTSRIFARSGELVEYTSGATVVGTSGYAFHYWPDGAAIFPDTRNTNPDGWVLASNSEVKDGGVGAVTFDKNGNVINYQMVLRGTSYNCNGGATSWGTWISAEEDFDKYEGRAWQVDPFGIRAPEAISLGEAGGAFEAFAYDDRNKQVPRFFLTEDDVFGALSRFTPTLPADGTNSWETDPWSILTGPGVTDWLVLVPTDENDPSSGGTFFWTPILKDARASAGRYYPESEGMDVVGNKLFFVCKGVKRLYELDLDQMTWKRSSTEEGLFEGEPDQIEYILGDHSGGGEDLLYFTEDQGRRAGIHARGADGGLFTILEGFYDPETTGLTLSPNGKHLYFCFQQDGVCFDVRRTDGLSFRAKFLNVKRHASEETVSK